MTVATNLETRVAGGVEYHVGGEGEPLLLLHGLGGASENWVEVLPELVQRYRVLAVDLPGHAGSRALARGATMDDFAAAAAGVLEAEEVESAIVAGHSFGGLVSLRLARSRPELVRALLLVAPAGIATTSRIAEATVIAAATIRPGRAVARFRHRWADRIWYRRALFRPWFVSDPVALSPRATHGLLAAQTRHTNTRVAGRAMVADDPRRDLPGVTCPVVLLWGARDAQLPLADAFEYARRLRAKLRLVADCGHLVIVERPHAVLDALAELDRLYALAS
ncbi:MAG: alpha/beta fold hydrolase [Gaiellaceae bacterium]